PLHPSDAMHLWLQRFSDLTVSRQVLETLILQLAVIIAAFLLAWGFRAATRSWSDRLAERVAARFRSLRIPAELHGARDVLLCLAGACHRRARNCRAWWGAPAGRDRGEPDGTVDRAQGVGPAAARRLACAGRCNHRLGRLRTQPLGPSRTD